MLVTWGCGFLQATASKNKPAVTKKFIIRFISQWFLVRSKITFCFKYTKVLFSFSLVFAPDSYRNNAENKKNRLFRTGPCFEGKTFLISTPESLFAKIGINYPITRF
jgi:hypothetical protein